MARTVTSKRSVELRSLGPAGFFAQFLLFVLKCNLLFLGAWIACLFGTLGGDQDAHEKVDLAFEYATADEAHSFAMELDRRGW